MCYVLNVKTALLDYDLPNEMIAQRPAVPRDAARLMRVDRAAGSLSDHRIADLPGLLRAGDLLVVNRTRVLPARFIARRAAGGRINGLFLHEDSPGRWHVLLAGRGRIREGETLGLQDGRWRLTLEQRGPRGAWRVAVAPPDPAEQVLERVGRMPLPPYIRREREDDPELDAIDRARYQTIFASEAGAVAAPTAGLHFTSALLDRLRDAGIELTQLTLHVGLGTFRPVEVDDLNDHVMHAEWYRLPAHAVAAIAQAKSRGGRVIAVGTTAVRVLETAARTDAVATDQVRGGKQPFTRGAAARTAPTTGATSSAAASTAIELAPCEGWTDLLIQPPFEFRVADALLTNFHLPRSTLLALVYAFAGADLTRRAYAAAIEGGYRFYSYGDAMLIE